MRTRKLYIFYAFLFFIPLSVVLLMLYQTKLRNNNFAEKTISIDSQELVRLERELQQLENVVKNDQIKLDNLQRNMEAKFREHPRRKILKIGPEMRPWREPIPVLLFVCNRMEAAREHVKKLIRYRNNETAQFPIIVSQDCDSREVQQMVQNEFSNQVQYIKHKSSETMRLKPPKEHRKFATYYKISRHYRLGLGHIFDKLNHSSVIITEDDLDIAPDFFEFFRATRHLLEMDTSLFCVSAWNDNGKRELIDTGEAGSKLLYRTDFFPGLGWMITRNFWSEIRSKWPPAFWDDFLREPEQRQNRSCIRPEVSRTAMTEFGRIGASKGLFFNRHLKYIVLNTRPVKFYELEHLIQESYDKQFMARVYAAPEAKLEQLVLNQGFGEGGGDRRIEYSSMDQFLTVARQIGIMADTKAGVQRTAYHGIISCFLNGFRVFIAPPASPSWSGYNREWQAPRDVLEGTA